LIELFQRVRLRIDGLQMLHQIILIIDIDGHLKQIVKPVFDVRRYLLAVDLAGILLVSHDVFSGPADEKRTDADDRQQNNKQIGKQELAVEF
jgi:hypothetical protein